MNKIVLIVLFCWSKILMADMPAITLEKAQVNRYDTASIQRGADFFGKVCIACHTLIYLRYNPIAKAAGITLERMPLKVTTWPNGIKPPDLSLEMDVRGAAWINTYLHSFYLDPKTVTGFNNLAYPNTAMANILAPFQGVQVLAKDVAASQTAFHTLQWYDVLELQQQGSMSPAAFDQLVNDLINFLGYAANPYAALQQQIGFGVLAFLIILWVLMFFLKKEYWKMIKKEVD